MQEDDLPKSIVGIGASSCFGIGDPEGGGFVGRFKNWYENSASPKNAVYNLGIPGDSLQDMKDRLAEVEKRKPQLIILQTGCNDCIRRESLDGEIHTDIESFSKKFRDYLQELTKLSKILVISHFPVDEHRTTPVEWAKHFYILEDIKKYSDKIKYISNDLDLEYVNIMSDWIDKEYSLFLSEDGLHPNSNGHEYIFHKVRDRFMKMYKLDINLKR